MEILLEGNVLVWGSACVACSCSIPAPETFFLCHFVFVNNSSTLGGTAAGLHVRECRPVTGKHYESYSSTWQPSAGQRLAPRRYGPHELDVRLGATSSRCFGREGTLPAALLSSEGRSHLEV